MTRGGIHAVFQHPALTQLPGLQRVVGLLDQVVADAVLAHDENGVDVVGQASQLGPLFACQFHVILLNILLDVYFPK